MQSVYHHQLQGRENAYLWPRDPDLWPMTLTFKVDPHIIQVHLLAEFYDPRSNGTAARVIKASCVGGLKQRKKETNKLGEN